MEAIELKQSCLGAKFDEYAAFVLSGGYKYDKENKDAVMGCIEVLEKNEVGLMILGNPGSGKTLFFEMCQRIIHPQADNRFLKISALDVVLKFNNKEIGHGVFKMWSKDNVLFDDLGTEEKGHLFGEKIEVFAQLIQHRYELFRREKIKTHFTTNLSYAQLKERYGIRCASRLNEMCSVVVLGGSVNYSDRRELKNFKGLPQVKHEVKKETGVDYEAYKLNRSIELFEQSEEEKGGGMGSRLRESMGITPEIQKKMNELRNLGKL